MKAIKELRVKANMSQREFCSFLNIPVRTVQDWEGGLRKAPDYVYELIYFQLRVMGKIPPLVSTKKEEKKKKDE